jgi:hypothetical protein
VNKKILGLFGVAAAMAFGATPTTTSLLVTPGVSAKFGAAVTLTATVATATKASKVTFYDGVNVVGLASVNLVTQKASLMTRLLPAGSNSLTARFDGDAVDAPSTSAAVVYAIVAGTADGFSPAANAMAHMYPESIAVGVFKGAHQDLAVANYGTNDVSVLLGNGDGTFGPPTNYPAGMGPHSIVVGDFNNDGVRDLAVANLIDNTVSILLGAGGGLFHPAVPYGTGSRPYTIAIGDFNRDGIEDLVVVNDNTTVSVLLGKGDGTFKTPIPHVGDTNIAPSSVVVADFNGDGKADVAVANFDLGTVSVLLGNGDGTFQPATMALSQVLPTGSRPYSITVGDFYGHGTPDVAVTDYFSGSVFVMKGVGNGSLDPPNPPMGIPTGVVPTSLAVGDFNGDGHLDLIVTNSYSNSVVELLGDGNGGFQNVASYTGSGLPDSVAVGKFNELTGDARTDVAIANFIGPINILLGVK